MRKRILAIEPEIVDRLILKRVLTDDYEVITLSSFVEALTFAKSNSFDIAIINNKLINHNDGIRLLETLRKYNANFLPFATTALSDKKVDAMLQTFGFRAVAQKPLTTASLMAMLRDL